MRTDLNKGGKAMTESQYRLQQLSNLADIKEALGDESIQEGPMDALGFQKVVHSPHSICQCDALSFYYVRLHIEPRMTLSSMVLGFVEVECQSSRRLEKPEPA